MGVIMLTKQSLSKTFNLINNSNVIPLFFRIFFSINFCTTFIKVQFAIAFLAFVCYNELEQNFLWER